jgi:hypothetical protein
MELVDWTLISGPASATGLLFPELKRLLCPKRIVMDKAQSENTLYSTFPILLNPVIEFFFMNICICC